MEINITIVLLSIFLYYVEKIEIYINLWIEWILI
jgi:hypothetical protein